MEFRAYGGHSKLLSPKQHFNMFQPWKGVSTCGKRSSQVAKLQERTVNGILTHRCRDVLFSPKKLGLQDADVKRNLGLSLLWQGIPALQRAAVSTSCPPSISRGRDALELRFGAELRLTCQGKNGSQGTEKAFARTKLLDKTELCGEHEIWNETVRKLTSLLLAPLLQRGPGVLAESLTSHWDA